MERGQRTAGPPHRHSIPRARPAPGASPRYGPVRPGSAPGTAGLTLRRAAGARPCGGPGPSPPAPGHAGGAAAPPETRPRSLPPKGRDGAGPAAGNIPSVPCHRHRLPGLLRKPRGHRAASPAGAESADPPAEPLASSQDCLPAPHQAETRSSPFSTAHPPSLLSPSHRARATGGVSPLMPHSHPLPSAPHVHTCPRQHSKSQQGRGSSGKNGEQPPGSHSRALGSQRVSSPSVQPAGGQGPGRGYSQTDR